MDFFVLRDLKSIMEIMNWDIEAITGKLHISRITWSKWNDGSQEISAEHLHSIYTLAVKNQIQLNQIKQHLYQEECTAEKKLLLHGAKTSIDGPVDLSHSRLNNDFGSGFYCGESLEQTIMFVSNFPSSSLYMFELDLTDLKYEKYNVDRDWMLTIAYFHNRLQTYRNHPVIQKLAKKAEDLDVIIAPIADNRMYQIIDQFLNGEITDIQCQHCLSATDLGYQYILKTPKALKHLKVLEHCYLTDIEKESYLHKRAESVQIGRDKVKLAKRKYRNQGLYIDEVFNEEN